MTFTGINDFSVLVAAIAGFVVGAAWYGALSKHWTAALGWKEGDMADKMPVVPMLMAFVALLVMALMLAGLVAHLGIGQATVLNGIFSGAAVWLGFVATTTVVNNAFQRRSFMLTLIDSGHWLAVLIVQGAIIGAMA